MAEFHIDITSSITCPHGGKVVLTTTNNKVLTDHKTATLQSDIHTITGCPFNVNGSPQPCVTLQWTTAATKVTIMKQPVLIKMNTGICKNAAQVPQGPPNVSSTQIKVKAL